MVAFFHKAWQFLLPILIFLHVCNSSFTPHLLANGHEHGKKSSLETGWHETASHGTNEKRAADISTSSVSTISFKNISQADVSKARAVVADALTKVSAANKARFEHPRRNKYPLKSTGETNFRVRQSNHFEMTKEITTAAALVAELDISAETSHISPSPGLSNSSLREQQKLQSTDFWMENIERLGSQPYGNDKSYKVFRNVQDYGAKGDGFTDDTNAINNAIKDGIRCGQRCYGTSVKNAIVYFPNGTYLVSTPIEVLYGTQLIGNAKILPTIKAARQFVGFGVITTDIYRGGGKGIDGGDLEDYLNTANFYRQIRNFNIDIAAAETAGGCYGIHYQVSQATSLFNVHFTASTDPNTKQVGIFAENGSGGFISDLTFTGGAYGIRGGNQQFTAHRLQFTNVKTAIWLVWDWGWTWKNLHIIGSTTGIDLTSEGGDMGETGSVFVQDSIFENTQNAIVSFPPNEKPESGSTILTLDNVAFQGVGNAVVDNSGKVWLAGNVGSVDTFVLGPTHVNGTRGFAYGGQFTTPRPAGLTGQSKSLLPKPIFFEHPRPQYENISATNFVHVKKNGAKGDGVTDDTVAIQTVINQNAASGNIIYVDAGSYVLTDTIKIPSGVKIVGELWAQLVASGPKFSDAKNPRALVQVGAKGEKGSVEIQDLLFTTVGPTAGLVTVEWNLEADSPGSAAMWDCHVRIGGAIGSRLTSKECPPLKSGLNQNCNAGSMMLHITPQASAYLENVWLWVGDHDLDDADLNDANNTMPQLSVYVARGMLIESTKPTWLYGTSSEHAVFYQYEFYRAKNVHAGMIQTESAYYQPNPMPPAPFTDAVGTMPGDPSYSCGSAGRARVTSGCDASWAVRIVQSSDISFAGAGLYSWFSTYDQSCVDSRSCQKSLMQMEDNGSGITVLNLITIGSENMIIASSGDITAKENAAVQKHPKWSYIALYQPKT